MRADSEHPISNMEVARRAALLFFPVAALFLISLYAVYALDRDSAIESLMHEEEVVVHQQEQHFTRTFNTIVSDLLVLTGHADFKEMLNDLDDDPYKHLFNISHEFLSFIDHKGTYDQLRFLNMEGLEIVRIDLNSGQPKIIPKEKRQNKADRYYFKKTASLEKGQIYISPFDLNVENGKIEQPLKPMLRVAIPVIDKHDVRHGIIILNFLGKHLLNVLGEISTNAPGETLVLNTDGYWLKGLVSEDEWGFMFPERSNKTFGSRFPDAWSTIATTDKGTLTTKHGLFTYATVKPLTSGWASASGNYRAYQPEPGDPDLANYSWKIVSFVPSERIQAESSRLRLPLLVLGIILTIVWGMYSLLSSNARAHKKIARQILKEKDQRIREIIDSAFDGIITINENGIISSFNPAASTIFGYAADEVIGKNINLLVPSPHREMHNDYLRRYIETREAHVIDKPREVEAVRKDGTAFPLSLCIGAKQYSDHWMFTGIVRDITERKKMEGELEKMAVTDALTGIYNRGYFNRHLVTEFNRSKRYDVPLSLIILDIDHFKAVNDTYGHPAGDALLIAVATELHKLARDTDIVARYGGEEFVLILPQTDGQSALILAERLRKAVAEIAVSADKEMISVTISLGLACIPGSEADSPDHYLRIADRALYQAKETGRNKTVLGTD